MIELQWHLYSLIFLLGFVYLVAFWSAAMQSDALIGSDGLLPMRLYLDAVAEHFDGRWNAFLKFPSLFWVADADWMLTAVCWLGVALSVAVMAGDSASDPMALLSEMSELSQATRDAAIHRRA